MKRKLILILAAVLTLSAVFYLGRTTAVSEGEESQSKSKSEQAPKASPGFEIKKASDLENPKLADKKSDSEDSSPSESGRDTRGEGMVDISNRFQQAMKTRNERKVTKLIDRLVEELGLDESQRVELEKYFAEQAALVNGLAGGAGAEDPMASVRAMQALEGQNLGEMLDGVLTPEQKELWEKSEKERAERVADSGALKELAKLNEVMTLREEQREAVYDHFYQKSLERENETGARAGISAMVGSLTSGLGIEFDSSLFDGGMPDLSGTATEQERMAAMKEHRDQQIEEQVQEIAPLLDEEQQSDYREHLKSRGGLLNGLFGGGR